MSKYRSRNIPAVPNTLVLTPAPSTTQSRSPRTGGFSGSALGLQFGSADKTNDQSTLGLRLMQLRQYPEALIALQSACESNPHSAERWCDLGACQKEAGQIDAAIESLKRSLELKSGFPPTLVNLTSCLYENKRFDEAYEYGLHAVEADPTCATAQYNLGLVLVELGRDVEAEATFKVCIRLAPQWVDAHINVGVALSRQGRIAESLQYFVQAIELDGFHANAHLNLGLNLLRTGDFETGLREHEWRRASEAAQCPEAMERPWDGTVVDGMTLLLTCEQGLGDTIQFSRYASILEAKGMQVVLAVQPSIKDFLTHAFPSVQVIGRQVDGSFDTAVDFDCRIPLLSLPFVLKQTVENIPAEIPYISAEPAYVDKWARIVNPAIVDGTALKIGIVWAGNPTHRNDAARSCELKQFAALAQINGVQLFSLQKGYAEAHLGWEIGFDVVNLSQHIENFRDTAGAIAQMDLVVSVDTSVVHLAGAMGFPVWTLLPQSSDWRWMVGREDSPWYPTIRLFRQEAPNSWPDVFQIAAQKAYEQIRWKTMGGNSMWQNFCDQLSRENWSAATEAAAELALINPNDTARLNAIGAEIWNAGGREQSLHYFLAALVIAPADRDTVLNCHDAMEAFGLHEDSKAVLQAYLNKHPSDLGVAKLRTACD